MKHVPKYLLPRIAPVSGPDGESSGGNDRPAGFVPFKKSGDRDSGGGEGEGEGEAAVVKRNLTL